MTQNLISVHFSDADIAALDDAIGTLERIFASFLELTPEDRRTLAKMGDKSEAFCRQTLVVLAQNAQMIPPSFNLAEAQNDLAALDLMRPRFTRLRQILGKVEDTETALGSDILSAALEGYAFAKVFGKGAGLEALREAMSARYTRKPKAPTPPTA
ncbi:MAG TPA: hypothetical protein PKE01_02945 [Rhodocyclaceae bacterium]|uniref:hypothetical protein n=1 Tax=Zoogloea sp. TaxID=49181 RepID=UPI002BD24F2D|nr:hypothetical protein [Zoogloea sp.]HMV62260.1 hypothetical protein [Rhodocyclaceae bacterium]HND24560.1 hypothetical protein [Rhodocyclaceae bacterium]HNE17253.1 hypothetical protein [Rhodocyclaceae bacterium]HNF62847.1 hypothetical protein [Rhodocyclaceae bacterium]HNH15798.1 hypothetical protein [Zoogloea sp.]